MNSRGVRQMIERLRHELRYAWPTVRAELAARQKQRVFRRWLGQLSKYPPQVMLGANIDINGGVRQHLLGIQKYSALSVQLAPPDWLRSRLTYHDFHTVMRSQFFDFKPDGIRAVHSHVYPYFIEWCAKQRNFSTKWVHTYHAPYLPEYGRDGLEPWQEEINRTLIGVAAKADVRISVSKWQQAWLRDNHGIESRYIPNGVDVELCDQATPQRFRDSSGLENFILYVGRNDPVKNPVDFIRLATRLPQHTFVMIGLGLSRDSMLSDWGIQSPDNLHFTGELRRQEVQDAIAASAAVVVTSKREGMPTLVLEAMTHRKTVVVPADPGCMEATDHGAFGFVFEHGDMDDLTSKTLMALNDGGDRDASREHVLQTYDWRVVAPRLDALYQGVNVDA
jgi:glycosyltransferase involved in cell wall biosynthesis